MTNNMFTFLQKACHKKQKQLMNERVHLSITHKCNMRCRHCVNDDKTLNQIDADYDSVLNWLEQIHEYKKTVVNLVGGEPFVLRKRLKQYVKKIGELGLFSSIVTNGFWAKTLEEAYVALEELPDLNILVLSTDKYHLEYVDAQTIKNAIEAGIATGKFVIIIVTYIEEQEVKEIKEIFQEYRNKVMIKSNKAMPLGRAATLNLKREPIFQMPDRVPASCDIGNYFIDCRGGVSSCCGATVATNTEYLTLGDLKKERFAEIIEKFNQNKIYNFIRQYGPRGLISFFSKSPFVGELMERKYTGACELCVDLLNNQEKLNYFLENLSSQ